MLVLIRETDRERRETGPFYGCRDLAVALEASPDRPRPLFETRNRAALVSGALAREGREADLIWASARRRRNSGVHIRRGAGEGLAVANSVGLTRAEEARSGEEEVPGVRVARPDLPTVVTAHARRLSRERINRRRYAEGFSAQLRARVEAGAWGGVEGGQCFQR